MNSDIKEILQKFDELGAYEFPSDFDYDRLEKMAKAVDNKLQSNGLKTTFEGAVYNQDASFSIAIVLEGYNVTSDKFITLPTIRFSNFGFLTTLTSVELMPGDVVDIIISAIKSAGLTYVPCCELDAPYDGVMDDRKTFSTWWIRYFDWL